MLGVSIEIFRTVVSSTSVLRTHKDFEGLSHAQLQPAAPAGPAWKRVQKKTQAHLRSFFSVASTTPLAALMPSEVAPAATAVSAYSICTSLPLGLKVVRLNEYCAPCTQTRVMTWPLAKQTNFIIKFGYMTAC